MDRQITAPPQAVVIIGPVGHPMSLLGDLVSPTGVKLVRHLQHPEKNRRPRYQSRYDRGKKVAQRRLWDPIRWSVLRTVLLQKLNTSPGYWLSQLKEEPAMPIADTLNSYQAGLSSPVQGGFDLTPSNGSDLAQVTRAVMGTGGGDLRVTLKNGDTITLPGLTPGVIYPVRVARVFATGTTATGVKGLVERSERQCQMIKVSDFRN